MNEKAELKYGITRCLYDNGELVENVYVACIAPAALPPRVVLLDNVDFGFYPLQGLLVCVSRVEAKSVPDEIGDIRPSKTPSNETNTNAELGPWGQVAVCSLG